MPDECDWGFSSRDDAKAEIRAAVSYLLKGAAGGARVISCRRSLRSCAMSRAGRHPSLRTPWTMACPVARRGTEAPRNGVALAKSSSCEAA